MNIYLKLYHKIRFISNIHDGISNLIDWIPIIWRDRWWDSSFLCRIISHKLELDAKEYKEQGHYVNVDRDARKMKICAELMKRLSDYDYFEKKTKIWDLDLDYEKIPGHSICDPISKKDSKKLRRAGEAEEALHKYYIEYCFEIMRKNLRSWWD